MIAKAASAENINIVSGNSAYFLILVVSVHCGASMDCRTDLTSVFDVGSILSLSPGSN